MRIMYVACASWLVACAAEGGSGSDAGVTAASDGVAVRWTGSALSLVVPESAVGETLVFTQDGARAEVQITAAQMALGTEVPAETFSPFAAGSVSWTLGERAGSATLAERFTTYFDISRAPDVSVSGLPTSAALGQTVTVSGTVGAGGLRPTGYVGLPSGGVTEVVLGEGNTLAAGTPFTFEVAVDSAGIYAVELLLPSGAPAAVLPIYAGDALPVLTPALDRGLTGAKLVDLGPVRAEVISRTNTLRAELGLPAVADHPTLADTSQAKADDIAITKVFAHQSAKLGGVADQAKAAGLLGTVKEALAVEYSAERAFEAWYWSPGHRTVLVDPSWRGQGVGVAWMDQPSGQLIFVHHVSTAAP